MASISTIWKPAGRAWKWIYHGCATSSGKIAEYAAQQKKPESYESPENVEQPAPAKPDWYAPYEALRRDWNEFIKRVRQTGIPSFYAKGYMDMIPRIRELMENTDIPAKSRAPLIKVLENHQRYLSTRKHILVYPGEAERHMDARASLQGVAAGQEIELTGFRPTRTGGRRPSA